VKVHKAYRYEVILTAGQSVSAAKHCGVARFAYNWGLARRIDEYKRTGKSSSAITQHKQLNKVKAAQFPWMYEVSKCAPQESLRNLDRAYKNFFRRVKQGKKPGFPRFKKRGVSRDSCRFTGNITVKHRKVKLPRIGWIRTKEPTEKFKGRTLSATLSRDADRWFVSVSVEASIPKPKPVKGSVVGVDLGINCFAVFSDGALLEAPKPLEKNLVLLAKRQRNMMRNHSLARRIADQGWAEFRRQLDYKTQWYGSRLVVAPRFYPSSKTCSACGHVKTKLALAERTYTCSECGLEIDRDLNAAQNLESLAYASAGSTGSSPGSNACGDGRRPRDARARCRRPSKKQESAVSEMITA